MQTQKVDGEQGEEDQVGLEGSGGCGCLREEGTHGSSLREMKPLAPQPTGSCGCHQSSHPSADCIQLKISPWEEGTEVESRIRAPFPETLLGGEGAHGWEVLMDIATHT